MFVVLCILILYVIWVFVFICVISVIEYIVVEGKLILSVNIFIEFEFFK